MIFERVIQCIKNNYFCLDIISRGHNKNPNNTPQLTTFANICKVDVRAKNKQPNTRALVIMETATA